VSHVSAVGEILSVANAVWLDNDLHESVHYAEIETKSCLYNFSGMLEGWSP